MDKPREIREHAERWYQAFKAWDVYAGETIHAGHRGGGGGFTVAGVGSYSMGVKSGNGASVSVTNMLLRTPIGPVSASLAAKVVTAAGEELARVRNDTSLQSLIAHNGRGWKSATARRYAVAVLDAAAQLGDRRADAMHRRLLKQEKAAQELQTVPTSPTVSVD